MFVFTVLLRVFESGREVRDRKDVRSATLQAAESARRVWLAGGHRVSPVVRMTGGAA